MRPPIASRRAESSPPHPSTAALSVVGDSTATSASAVPRTQSPLARQKSRRLIIVDMEVIEPRTQRKQRSQRKNSHRDTGTQRKPFLGVSVSPWLILLCVLCPLGV